MNANDDERNGNAEPHGRAIVMTFDDASNISLQATPDVTVADYVLAAFNLQRQANRLLEPKPSPIVLRDHLPKRQS